MTKLKSYAETKGKKPFDWMKWLNKKIYTLRDIRKKNVLSKSWVTCACGNQCSIIPRYEDVQAPKDIKLRGLGLDFNFALGDMQYHFAHERYHAFEYSKQIAINILLKIEERSAILIKKELKNSNKCQNGISSKPQEGE